MIEQTEENIEPFYAEIKGTLRGKYPWQYKLDSFLALLYAFNKKAREGKFYLRIGEN